MDLATRKRFISSTLLFRPRTHLGLAALVLFGCSGADPSLGDGGEGPAGAGTGGSFGANSGGTSSLGSGGSTSVTGSGGVALTTGGNSNSTGGAGSGGTSVVPPDCALITAAGYELCAAGADYCEVVFTDGSGCSAVCAAAGLSCAQGLENVDGQCASDPAVAEAGCDSGHQSDFCRCEGGGAPGATGGATGTGGAPGTGGATGTGGTASGGTVGTGGVTGTGGTNPADLPPVSVYIAGDSIVSTYTNTASTGDQAGWGQMLPEIFDDRVTVINRARGGRTARWFYLEGETQWILDRILPGDYFFIQFGTNDSHPTATFTVDGVTYNRLAAAGGAFKTHLKDYYLDPARQKSAIPVLVTPTPRNSAYCGTGNSLGGYAQAMRELAVVENVLLLDLNQKTFNHLSAICPAPSPENFFFLRADGTVDGTHFQENGARHMAGFLGEAIDEQNIALEGYLLP